MGGRDRDRDRDRLLETAKESLEKGLETFESEMRMGMDGLLNAISNRFCFVKCRL